MPRNLPSTLGALARIDLANVRRDSLLLGAAIGPLAMALLYRYGVPPLADALARGAGLDLTPYYGLLMSFFLMMPPALVGMIVGFLLLDERDDRTLAALLVTPMPLSTYLWYRVTTPLVVGILATLACYPIAGLATIAIADLAVIAGLASLTGPITALFLVSFAENKVAGFALVKIINLVNVLPIAAYFLDLPWQLVGGIVPGFWPMKMLWLATAGEDYLAYGLGGLVVNIVVLWLLLVRFKARAGAI
jgi:fluoroquinolone transport system permease protein